MERKMRFEYFLAISAQHIAVRGFRCAVVVGVDFAVWLQHFRETQRYFRSSWTRNAQSRPAHHILSELKNIIPRRWIGDLLRTQDFFRSDRLIILRHHCHARSRLD